MSYNTLKIAATVPIINMLVFCYAPLVSAGSVLWNVDSSSTCLAAALCYGGGDTGAAFDDGNIPLAPPPPPSSPFAWQNMSTIRSFIAPVAWDYTGDVMPRFALDMPAWINAVFSGYIDSFSTAAVSGPAINGKPTYYSYVSLNIQGISTPYVIQHIGAIGSNFDSAAFSIWQVPAGTAGVPTLVNGTACRKIGLNYNLFANNSKPFPAGIGFYNYSASSVISNGTCQ